MIPVDSSALVALLNRADVSHEAALRAFLAANRRGLSLVDCVSFEVMHQQGIEAAFAFDPHFADAGFRLIPSA